MQNVLSNLITLSPSRPPQNGMLASSCIHGLKSAFLLALSGLPGPLATVTPLNPSGPLGSSTLEYGAWRKWLLSWVPKLTALLGPRRVGRGNSTLPPKSWYVDIKKDTGHVIWDTHYTHILMKEGLNGSTLSTLYTAHWFRIYSTSGKIPSL